jgi:hypothetical protein
LPPGAFRLDRRSKKSIFDPTLPEVLDEKGALPHDVFFAAQSRPYRAIILEDEVMGNRCP